jgi:hypothetical protein
MFLSWSMKVSRSSDGGFVSVLTDEEDKKYKCSGGGYDMRGTCLAMWLNENYRLRLNKLAEITVRKAEDGEKQRPYGLSDKGVVEYAIGENAVIKIAEQIGINLDSVYKSRRSKNSECIGFLVKESPVAMEILSTIFDDPNYR